MRDTRTREMRRGDTRLRTETRAAYECPRRQVWLEETRSNPAHQWIVQVARGELEKDDVLIDDPAFLVLPDTRKRNDWASGDTRVVNLLVIFKAPELRTIRDLRECHLPTLERIEADVLGRVQELTGVPGSELYCYFNYAPSNPLLLHLHLAWPLPANRDSVRHHLLQTVRFNLRLNGDYYRDCPLLTAAPRSPRRLEDAMDGLTI